jgi:membrane associated rhomboid family serine protease
MIPPGVPFAPSPGYNPPAFNVPPGVGMLVLANVATFAAVLLLPDRWVDIMVNFSGLVPARFFAPWSHTEIERHAADYVPFVSYMFLHAGFTHLLFNMGFLLAFGGGVERRIGKAKMLAFYLLTGVLAGLFYALLHRASPVLLMGASGAVSGLFGGALRFLILEPRRAILAAIVWLIFTVLFGVIGADAFGEGGSIAWEAHVGGFVAGLVLFPLFDRRRT